mgnify:FL=1
MSLSDAIFFAALVTIVCAIGIAEKIIDVDMDQFLPENLKKAKIKRIFAERNTPLQGTNVQKEIKKAFESVLLPLEKADKNLLPKRMDMTFRRKMDHQIDLLRKRKLCRDIRLTDVMPLPKNNFKRWNDDGREWRESILQCSSLERLVSPKSGKVVHQIYRKGSYLRILQSRHIRHSDRQGKNKEFYSDKLMITCPSCGAEVELSGQQIICPYCGGVIQSEFYDWQTEVFEIYKEMGANMRYTLLLFAGSIIMFICLTFSLWLINDIDISLTIGVVLTLLVLIGILSFISRDRAKQEKMREGIVRYSENYLRSCISEVLYKEKKEDLLDYGVDAIVLKKVVNTEQTTEITVQVFGKETYLPEKKKPYTKKVKKTLVLQRARYPERRKTDGAFFIEKDCPSCGANFIPDENNCCSFCGYSLQIDNAKWKIK